MTVHVSLVLAHGPLYAVLFYQKIPSNLESSELRWAYVVGEIVFSACIT